MKKEKSEKRALPASQRAIRILILIIFVVALAIAAWRLLDLNRERKRLDEAQKQKEDLQDEIGAIEGEIERPIDEDYVKDHYDPET